MSNSAIITLIILTLFLFYIISIFNRLITLKNRYKNAFSQIEIQLKRRYDLIPNLIECVKGYLNHEKTTLENITKARNGATNALNNASLNPGDLKVMKDLSKAEAILNDNLQKFNIAVEAYPDLKSSQNMMQLSSELTNTENKISFARQAYNDDVMIYNTFKQTFPSNIFAKIFGHGNDASFLEFEDSKNIQNPSKISFN
jgi:LemA protein